MHRLKDLEDKLSIYQQEVASNQGQIKTLQQQVASVSSNSGAVLGATHLLSGRVGVMDIE